MSGISDMNGDGLDDFVIGAHHASPDPSLPKSGAAYIIFGQISFPKVLDLSTLDGKNGFQINGEDSLDYLGKSVKWAGDVNRDGLYDLIIGAQGASGPEGKKSGKAFVILGQKAFSNLFLLSSLDGTNGFEIDGADAYDGSGFDVSGAGDMDGDGYVKGLSF